jgi:hypothetical protein
MFYPSMGTNATPLPILHWKASFLTGKFPLMAHIQYISWQTIPIHLISQRKMLVICQFPEHVAANEHCPALALYFLHCSVNTAWVTYTYCNFVNTVRIQFASPSSPSYLLANSIYWHILFPQLFQINFHCTGISQMVLAAPTGRVIKEGS